MFQTMLPSNFCTLQQWVIFLTFFHSLHFPFFAFSVPLYKFYVALSFPRQELEHDISAIRYVASLLIAHTAVANSSSPRSCGKYKPHCNRFKWAQNPIRGHPTGPVWYQWIIRIWFPISHYSLNVHEAVSCTVYELSLIHIWRCRRSYACRSRWSPYH